MKSAWASFKDALLGRKGDGYRLAAYLAWCALWALVVWAFLALALKMGW